MSEEMSPTTLLRRGAFSSTINKPSICLRPSFRKMNDFASGYLGMQCKTNAFIKIVWVSIFGSKLLYFRSKSEIVPLGSIELSMCRINGNPTGRRTHKSHSFELFTEDSQIFIFSTRGKILKARWIAILTSHQSNVLEPINKNVEKKISAERTRSELTILKIKRKPEENLSSDEDFLESKGLQWSESDGNIRDGPLVRRFLGKGSFPEFHKEKRKSIGQIRNLAQVWAREQSISAPTSPRTSPLTPIRSESPPVPYDETEEEESAGREKMKGEEKIRGSLLNRLGYRTKVNPIKAVISPKRKASTARTAKEMMKRSPSDKGSIGSASISNPLKAKSINSELSKLTDEIKEKWEKKLDVKGSLWGDFPRIYRNIVIFSGNRRIVPGVETNPNEITRDDNTPLPLSPNIRKGLLGFITNSRKKEASLLSAVNGPNASSNNGQITCSSSTFNGSASDKFNGTTSGNSSVFNGNTSMNASINGKSMSSLEMRDMSVIRHYSQLNQQNFIKGNKSIKEKFNKAVDLEDLDDYGVTKIEAPFIEEPNVEQSESEEEIMKLEKEKLKKRNQQMSELLSLLATRLGEVDLAKKIEETFIDEVGGKSDLSRELPNYFQRLNENVDQIKILRLLKLISQSIVAPPYMRLRSTFAAADLPVKDLSGFWSIEVNFQENGSVMVCHSKRCSSNSTEPSEQFNFTWRMEILMDNELNEMQNVSLEIFSVEFGSDVPQRNKVKVNKIRDNKLFL